MSVRTEHCDGLNGNELLVNTGRVILCLGIDVAIATIVVFGPITPSWIRSKGPKRADNKHVGCSHQLLPPLTLICPVQCLGPSTANHNGCYIHMVDSIITVHALINITRFCTEGDNIHY